MNNLQLTIIISWILIYLLGILTPIIISQIKAYINNRKYLKNNKDVKL